MSFDRLPLVVGHRGAAGLAPENTIQSFELADTTRGRGRGTRRALGARKATRHS